MMMTSPLAAFWMPPAASTFARSVDSLFNFVTVLNVFFFILIVGAMAYFAVKYRRRSEDQKTSPIRGNHKVEIAWSAIPGVLLLVIFAWGFQGFMHMSVTPEGAEQIRVTGQKWSWAFTYPNGGTSNELVVPVGEPIELTMSSVDVLHSFYIPAFRTKRDVLPNRYTVLWFQSDDPGEYPVYCTEYCGTSHSQMLATVRVVERDEYEAFMDELGGCPDGDSLEACGEVMYARYACNSCHSNDGSGGVGPTFAGLYGTQRPLADGSNVLADETYIANSIVNPADQVAEGFQPVMPGNYGQQLSEEQLNALVAYIASLGGQE